ncbi:hypothetical protein BM536_029350 [Streptomyces phaeoluteigriseus]|uniref:Uncharacterized protein n=1 Tax=Streptomyces phaeoluteigriseus TaxID=114686 RepID=A0A1V6ML71_9ACTN|nr:hypothetical protein [Streptomyces phaeoluteigriseus]OQD53220.1 hypothetical protein BM536_029350 [Streptomyces phaeoluteigriseus]
MVDHRLEGPGENGTPVPRDLPDQQADAGDDPWEVAPTRADENAGTDADPDDTDADTDGPDTDGPDTDVPDTDEAGTGRQGAPRPATVNADHPTPDEPTG